MTRRHLPWGWSWGGLSSLEPVTAACPVPRPPAPSCRPPLLLSEGLFKISSMEKDRPSFLGASQHPESFLSIPRLGTLRGWLGGGQRGLVDAQGDAGGGWLLPPPRLLGSRGQAKVESQEPHVGLSGRDAASPGTSMGRCRSRLGSRWGSHGKSWAGCTPVGFSLTAKGLLRAGGLRL